MKETTNFGASTMKTLHGKMLSDDELLFANKVTLTYRGNIFYPCILDASSPLLKDDADSDVRNELYALNAEISQFGVILGKKTITNLGITLSYLGPTDRAKFYEVWIEAIRRSKGADKQYIPFYPGFPQQVRELSEFEWMFNAFCHYISDGKYFTTETERIQYAELKKNRKFAECLEDMKTAKPIEVSTLDDVQKIAYSIMAAPTSISDFDKEITNDRDAILKALEDNFTVRSTERNKGMGLSIIIAPAIEARIFSHNGLVYKHDSIIEGFDCKMSFPGTLIYYEIDLSKMDDEEIMNEFDFFN